MPLPSKFVPGPTMYIDWIGPGGTAVIAAQYQKFNTPFTSNKANVSSGGDTFEEFLPTLQDLTVAYEGLHDGTASPLGTADLNNLKQGNWGTLRWGAKGTAAGQPKGSILCFVTKSEIDYPFDNAVTVKLEFQNSGVLLSDPNTGVWP